MDYVEVEGTSIDDAIARALQRLGVERDRVEIEIVSNATRGLFGLGGRKAVVRATLRSPLSLESAAAPTARTTPVPGPPRAVAGNADFPQGRASTASARATEGSFLKDFSARPEPIEGRTERKSAPPEPAEESMTPEADGRILEQARAILERIARMITAEAQVEIGRDAEGPSLVIAGDTSGALIGRRGQTLDALEYVINRIVQRDEDGSARIAVDSQNYRARRRESLVELAQRVAERARRRGKTVTLNPMSPRDRRIIHLALRNDPSLVTRSSGKGYFRKLLIIPRGDRRGGGAARGEKGS